jgi:hypothetical protein
MNDDLDQKLRESLHRGTLPAAPESLRQRLAQLPGEPAPARFAGLLSGIRLAALGTAFAMVVAFVVVARSLPGPGSVGPAGSVTGLRPSAGPSASPSLAASPSAPGLPSGAPTPAPSASSALASPPPEPSGTVFVCGTTVLPKTTSTSVGISDVRVGSHPGAYDRIVFEFNSSARPQLTVAPATPPFVEDASGQPVNVPGRLFLSLKLFGASGYPTYSGPSSFMPDYANLESLVNTGDYEGYVTWIAGLQGPACYHVSTLTGPTRIVVDVEEP